MKMLELIQSQLTERTTRFFSEKTRDRILSSSLALFNEQSFQTVTTAAIAEHAGILEGTLWYHFPSKKDILSAHIELLQLIFEEENSRAADEDATIIVEGIFGSYDVIWDFRYVLRDDFNFTLKNEPDLLQKTQEINAFLDLWTEGRVIHSAGCGLLSLSPENIENTSELILLIGRHWLDFSSKKYPLASPEELRKKGLTHIFNVLEQYLSSEAKDIASALLRL
jgi:AcrR family transcriptional regulator